MSSRVVPGETTDWTSEDLDKRHEAARAFLAAKRTAAWAGDTNMDFGNPPARGWCRGMVAHLQTSLAPRPSEVDLNSSVAWVWTRKMIVEVTEDPRTEVFTRMLVFVDVLMVSIEAVIDHTFNFGHGSSGSSSSSGMASSSGGSSSSGMASSSGGSSSSGSSSNSGQSSGLGLEAVASSHGSTAEGTHDEGLGSGRRLLAVLARNVVGRILSISGESTCDPGLAQDIANICRLISITVLLFFAAEILLNFFMAPKRFLLHFGHVLDAVVVGGSIFLEFTLHHSEGGLLLLFRLWRIVRVSHGLLGVSRETHQTLEHLEDALHIADIQNKFLTSRGLLEEYQQFVDGFKSGADGCAGEEKHSTAGEEQNSDPPFLD